MNFFLNRDNTQSIKTAYWVVILNKKRRPFAEPYDLISGGLS